MRRFITYSVIAVFAILGLTSTLFADFSSDDPGLLVAAPDFDGDFVALSDAHRDHQYGAHVLAEPSLSRFPAEAATLFDFVAAFRFRCGDVRRAG